MPEPTVPRIVSHRNSQLNRTHIDPIADGGMSSNADRRQQLWIAVSHIASAQSYHSWP